MFSLIPTFSFANNIECNNNIFQIIWNDNTKTSIQNNFFIESRDPSIDTSILDIAWVIEKNSQNVFPYTGNNLDYVFKSSGLVTIKSSFQHEWCNIKLSKDVYVYQKIHLYIWDKNDIIFDIENQFKIKDELFIIIWNEQLEKIKNYLYLLEKSDNIIISQNSSSEFLDILYKYQDVYAFDIATKKIYVLVGNGKQFTKKILVKYLSFLKINTIYIINNNRFWDLIWHITNDDTKAIDWLTEELSIKFSGSNKLMFMSYFTDTLILNGFSMQVLGLIFSTAISVLVIAFFRQVVWFSVFGLYNPLLFAMACVIWGLKISLILFGISIVATIMTRIFTKKIYLLYSAKISILYLIYILLFIISFGLIYNFFPWLVKSINFSDVIIVLLIVIMPIVTNKILWEWSNIRSWSFWIFLAEFFFLTLILFFIYQSTFLTNMMIAYPELIIILLTLNVFVGRFTWLQALEYLRFAPLIKRLYEEEE